MRKRGRFDRQRALLKPILMAVALFGALAFTTTASRAADPSPWNGPVKQSIITFVEKVTNVGSADFVPVAERIATFDNDGTLWGEQPEPVQLNFALDRVTALAPQHPERVTSQPFASLLKVDLQTGQSPVIAIDILLEPDAVMLKHAEANNARLLKAYPEGFALDAAHRPHITMLQCFVRTADLDKVYAAMEKVLAPANVTALRLEAFKFYYAPSGTVGVAGISAQPTPEIVKLQADIIAAAKPFMLQTGPIAAFTAGHGDPATDAAIIDYVSTFVPKMSGENFNPHVSTGVAPKVYLDKMLDEPFEPFTFSPAGAAIYQLGPFGTAAKKLRELNVNR